MERERDNAMEMERLIFSRGDETLNSCIIPTYMYACENYCWVPTRQDVCASARDTRQGRLCVQRGKVTGLLRDVEQNISLRGYYYNNIVTDLLFSSNEICIIFFLCVFASHTNTIWYYHAYNIICIQRFIPTSPVLRYRWSGFFFHNVILIDAPPPLYNGI